MNTTWLQQQIEWLKSFISDPQINGENKKGSSKRVSAMVLILLFLYEYNKISNVVVNRIKIISDVDFIALLKVDKLGLPDIPDSWLIIIGSVLGITIIDYVYKKKKTKEDEIEAKVSRQTQNLHNRIAKLEDNK